MSEARTTNPTVKLNNVRLSFPSLFTARQDQEDKTKKPKFEATFILDKKTNAADIKAIQAAIEIVKKSPVLKGRKPTKIALRAGDDTEQRAGMDGYGPGVYTLSARNHRRPAVVDRDLSPLAEEDGKLYPGCYVNATVEIYPYIHPKSGPGITASLRAVQYLRKGDPLGEAPVQAEKEFEALGADEEESVV